MTYNSADQLAITVMLWAIAISLVIIGAGFSFLIIRYAIITRPEKRTRERHVAR